MNTKFKYNVIINRIFLLFIISFMLTLSGCSTINPEEDNEDPIDIVDEDPLDDEPVDEDPIDDDPIEIVYDELESGELDKLIEAFDKVDLELAITPQLIVDANIIVTNHNLDDYYAVTTNAQSYMEIDFEELYIYYLVTESGYSIIDKQLIAEKDGKIIQYRSDSDGYLLEAVLSEDTSSQSIYNVLMDIGFSGGTDYSFIGNVEQTSNYIFTAQIAFHRADEFFGEGFTQALSNYGDVDYNTLRFDVVFTFDYDFRGYNTDVSFTIEGYTQGINVRTEMEFTQEVNLEIIEKLSIADLGFTIPTARTIDSIEYTASLLFGRNYKIIPNENNWIRYYLEPGYYKTSIFTSQYENMQIYNELNEPIYNGFPLVIEEAGYYYVNLESEYHTEKYFDVDKLDIIDIHIETISTSDTFTITGNIEGKEDINKLIFEAQDRDYILLFEMDSTIDIYYLYKVGENYYSEYCPVGYCTFIIPEGEGIEIRLISTSSGDFDLTVHFLEPVITTQDITDIENIEDISVYNFLNPLEINEQSTSAFFLVTLDHYGKYQLNTWCVFGDCRSMDYDFYTLDGVKLDLGKMNGDYIDAGSYIVEVYYEYNGNYDVFYPTLYERD